MLEVLGDILDEWGDECVEGLATMRPEVLFRKTRDVLSELSQLSHTQGILIQNLKGDMEDIRGELQNETKHSLTTQLQQCQNRIDEDNRIAKTILSCLAEKDSTIRDLREKLRKYARTAEKLKEAEQESSFLASVLCEAHRQIQVMIPVQESILLRSKETIQSTALCLDTALAAEKAFQIDARVNADEVIPSVRVKRQPVKP
ncbi:hypothetical protein BESB_016900 [Besnoitia besnoiti]|uniref:Uncharacterized protein n=1 Tax=Besnoitia besnoiti TaxID=94643 RepID=A0A2A9MAF9_BESBE|nr:hypothetical protein BESB_016900 [Besnoitia besnoiti]PFH32372.1 hypothetical protein BESB_016900 [Besnoitia besnoiti]